MAGAGDPFRFVRSGERLRIPASAYNAFVEAAKAERRRRTSAQAEPQAIALSYDTLIHNMTGSDLPRFGVVALGAPVTTPAQRLASFQSRQALTGTTPAAADRGRFAILQEPIRAGGIGRALASGISLVQVELLAPVTTRDDFADIKPGSTAVLLGAASGSAQLLWVEPHADRVDPAIAWCVVRLGDQQPGGDFTVRITVDGGSAGSDEETCSWTYTVKSLRDKVIGTSLSPTAHRKPNIPYVETPADSDGVAYYNQNGQLVLLWANEQEDVESCEGDGGPSEFVLTAPTSTADNTIVAQSNTVSPLTLVAAAGQSAPMLDLRNNGLALVHQFGVNDFVLGTSGSVVGSLALQSELRFFDGFSNFVSLQAPANLVGQDYQFTLPDGYGNPGEILKTDGNGEMSWGTLAHSALTGLTTGDPHTQYVAISPASSTRNTITAGDSEQSALRIRAGTGGLALFTSLFAVQNNAGTTSFLSVNPIDAARGPAVSIQGCQLDLRDNASARFYESAINGTNRITVLAPAILAGDFTITLPAITGTVVVTAGDQTIGGVKTFTSNLQISTAGSSSGSPRILGFVNLASGDHARFQFGDQFNALANHWGGGMVLGAYWGVTVRGHSASAVPFVNGSVNDPGLRVLNAQSGVVALAVDAAAGQTADLQQWRSSTPAPISVVDSTGRLGLQTSSPGANGAQCVRAVAPSGRGTQAVEIDCTEGTAATAPFIDYRGDSASDDSANISTDTNLTNWALAGFVKIEVNGVARWMPFYDRVSSGGGDS
jgi:hypothetical protein